MVSNVLLERDKFSITYRRYSSLDEATTLPSCRNWSFGLYLLVALLQYLGAVDIYVISAADFARSISKWTYWTASERDERRVDDAISPPYNAIPKTAAVYGVYMYGCRANCSKLYEPFYRHATWLSTSYVVVVNWCRYVVQLGMCAEWCMNFAQGRFIFNLYFFIDASQGW